MRRQSGSPSWSGRLGRVTLQLEMAKKVFGDSDFLFKDGG